MSVKLLLAESLDILRKAEDFENAADRLQIATAKGQTKSKDFLPVKRQYSAAYDMYIRGLELMNYVRRQAIDTKIAEMQHFCTQKMTAYMNRCDALRDKEANILMTVDQADSTMCMDKEGFAMGQIVFQQHAEIKQNSPIKFQGNLHDGAYQLIVKNYDQPGVAQAEVTAVIAVQGVTGKSLRFAKHVGPRCAWSRYVGVLNSAQVTVSVSTDAWVRTSKIDVTLRELIPLEPEGVPNVVGGAIPKSEGWFESLPELPPVEPLPAAPSGLGYPAPQDASRDGQQPAPLGGVAATYMDPTADLVIPGGEVGGPAPVEKPRPVQPAPAPVAPSSANQNAPQPPQAPPLAPASHQPPAPATRQHEAPRQVQPPTVAAPYRVDINVAEWEEGETHPNGESVALRIAQLKNICVTQLSAPRPPHLAQGCRLNAQEAGLLAAVKALPDPSPLFDADFGDALNCDLADMDLE